MTQNTTVETLLQQGREQLDRGQYQTALETFQQAAELEPQNSQVLYGCGLACYLLERYQESVKYLDLALEIKPNYILALASRGGAYKQIKQDEKAKTDFEKAIEIEPQDYEGWRGKGIALFYLGRHEEAISSFDKAIEINPNKHFAWNDRGITLHHLRRYEEAIASYDQAIEITPNKHFAWINRGIVLSNLGRSEEAISSYDQAIKINPNQDQTWNTRGIALHHLRRYEDAIASYDKAIEINSNQDETWNNRGNALYYLRRYEEAITSYNKAIEINSNYYFAWENQGIALNELKRYEEALISFDKAIEINPNHQSVWVNRGIALYYLGRYEEAIASYNKAIEINSNYYFAWENQGIALNELKRYEEALISFDKAIEINPNHQSVWVNRGIALNKLKRYEEALISFDKAIEINPNQDATWNSRGFTLNELKRYEEALMSCDKAIEINPNNHFAWNNRGNALYYLQRYGEAIISYYKAINIKHDYWHTRNNLGLAYYNQGRQQTNPFDDWIKAKASYEQALKYLEDEHLFKERLEVMQNLIQVSQYLMSPNKVEELRRQATDFLDAKLQDPQLSLGQQIELKRKFSAFAQVRVDTLAQSKDTAERIQALELAEQRKNTCISWLRQKSSSDADYLSYSRIQDLLNPHTAAIFWHISPTAITTFIIKYQQPLIVLSPQSPPQPPQQSSLSNTQKSYLAHADQLRRFEKWLQEWKKDYQNYCQGNFVSKEEAPWRIRMQFMLKGKGKLSEILEINRIREYVADVEQLILIPHRELHLLPLHYLFPSKFTITYLPSFQIGLNLQIVSPEQGKLLNVENPCNDLPFAKIESVAISSLFADSHQLAITNTTKQTLLEALKSNTGYFHFTGHGYHKPETPRESALVLSESHKLTLGDIFDDENLHLSQYKLICLSACETGITSQEQLLDEYVGLASGFLAKQVSYVVSTLWRVDERSTALLMIQFYQLINQGKPPAQALKQAQNWLHNATYQDIAQWYRDLGNKITEKDPQCSAYLETEALIIESDRAKIESTEPLYAHPYYWAGFILTGKTN